MGRHPTGQDQGIRCDEDLGEHPGQHQEASPTKYRSSPVRRLNRLTPTTSAMAGRRSPGTSPGARRPGTCIRSSGPKGDRPSGERNAFNRTPIPSGYLTQAFGRWMVMRSSVSVIADDTSRDGGAEFGRSTSALPITDNAFRSGAGEICTTPSSGRFISRKSNRPGHRYRTNEQTDTESRHGCAGPVGRGWRIAPSSIIVRRSRHRDPEIPVQ